MRRKSNGQSLRKPMRSCTSVDGEIQRQRFLVLDRIGQALHPLLKRGVRSTDRERPQVQRPLARALRVQARIQPVKISKVKYLVSPLRGVASVPTYIYQAITEGPSHFDASLIQYPPELLLHLIEPRLFPAQRLHQPNQPWIRLLQASENHAKLPFIAQSDDRQQTPAKPIIRLDPPLQRRLKHPNSIFHPPCLCQALNQTCASHHIRLDPALQHLFKHLQRPARLPPAPVDIDHRRVAPAIRPPMAVARLHILKQLLGFLLKPKVRAHAQQRIIQDEVHRPSVRPHSLPQLQRVLAPPRPAVDFNQGGQRLLVRRKPRGNHLFEQAPREPGLPGFAHRLQQRIVHHHIRFHVKAPHLSKDILDPVIIPCLAEHPGEHRECDRVARPSICSLTSPIRSSSSLRGVAAAAASKSINKKRNDDNGNGRCVSAFSHRSPFQTIRLTSIHHQGVEAVKASTSGFTPPAEGGVVVDEILEGSVAQANSSRTSFLAKLAIALGIAATATLISVCAKSHSGSSYSLPLFIDSSSQSVQAATPVGFNLTFFGYNIIIPEYTPGWVYFWLLMAAGCGLFISEEALNVWVGMSLARKLTLDGNWQAFTASFSKNAPYIISTVLWVYWGVCISDMIPYYLGRMFRKTKASEDICTKLGIGKEKAEIIAQAVQKYGNLIGFVERFSVGVRNPTGFLAGAWGISADCFFAGVCGGGLITLSIQLAIGFLLRERPAMALAGVATVVGIWTVFPYILAASTALFLFLRRRQPNQ